MLKHSLVLQAGVGWIGSLAGVNKWPFRFPLEKFHNGCIHTLFWAIYPDGKPELSMLVHRLTAVLQGGDLSSWYPFLTFTSPHLETLKTKCSPFWLLAAHLSVL